MDFTPYLEGIERLNYNIEMFTQLGKTNEYSRDRVEVLTEYKQNIQDFIDGKITWKEVDFCAKQFCSTFKMTERDLRGT